MKKNCCAFVRVVQSNNGWTQPCGMDYGHGKHFASTSGFGFEEWMCSDHQEFVINNTTQERIIHIEAFRQGFNPEKINHGKLYLWCYDHENHKKVLVGFIAKYKMITDEEILIGAIKSIFTISDLLSKEVYTVIDKRKSFETIKSNIETKLKNKEKKFNLIVKPKDLVIFPKAEWIELPNNLFAHNRFVAYYNYNDQLMSLLSKSEIL